MAFKIVFRFREHREERMLLGSRVTIGRDPANDIVIDDPGRSLSRFHARLDFDGRYWRIVDTRSTNRVRVNGELIEPDEAAARVLADGDAILLGGFEVHFLREAVDAVVLEDEATPGGNVTLQTPLRLEDLSGLIAAPPSTRLPQEAEEAIERARKALAVLGTIGGRIAAVTPVDDIIDTMVDLVFEATPAERAALFLWDEEAGRLVPKRTRTRSSGEAVTMAVSQSLVEQALAENAVVQMDAGAGLSVSMHSLRLRSAIAVPLAHDSRVVGVIYADTSLLTGAFDAFGVALLSALASHTAIALEQTRLLRKNRQEERWRMRLVQYLAPPVVDRILSGGSSPNWGMRTEEVEVTVLFCDMAGFTARTENMEPHDVLVLLNRCFSRMTEVVQEQGGTVDKYIGDCLMAVFGAPFPQPDHPKRAVLASLGVRDAIRQINAEGDQVEVGFRMGMHSGRVVAGDVGHVTRRNWTVLGPTVNLASRMESSVAQPGQIVLTGETRAGLGEEFELRLIENVRPPKGITREFQAYELLGVRQSD
jgi:adenylate cyclase